MRWRNEDNEKWKVESWRGSWKLGTDSLWGGNCGSQAQAAWRIQGIVKGAGRLSKVLLLNLCRCRQLLLDNV
jgi:hypothetical protein